MINLNDITHNKRLDTLIGGSSEVPYISDCQRCIPLMVSVKDGQLTTIQN
jgi:hypothetical protein